MPDKCEGTCPFCPGVRECNEPPEVYPVEIQVEVPATLKVFKDLKTGHITAEVHVDGSMMADYDVSKLGAGWPEFFESEVNSRFNRGDFFAIRVSER